MVDLFLATAAEQLAQADAAATARNATELAQTAHRLKGSCLGVSAVRMAELAAALESAGIAAKLDEAPNLVAKLCAALDRASAYARGLS